jgi:hypothetical protein
MAGWVGIDAAWSLNLIFEQFVASLSANRHIRGARSTLQRGGEISMSSLDFEFDLDTQISHWEAAWRHAYESSIIARSDYQTLSASRKANANLLDLARERLDRAEALKARIMARMERLEDHLLG